MSCTWISNFSRIPYVLGLEKTVWDDRQVVPGDEGANHQGPDYPEDLNDWENDQLLNFPKGMMALRFDTLSKLDQIDYVEMRKFVNSMKFWSNSTVGSDSSSGSVCTKRLVREPFRSNFRVISAPIG